VVPLFPEDATERRPLLEGGRRRDVPRERARDRIRALCQRRPRQVFFVFARDASGLLGELRRAIRNSDSLIFSVSARCRICERVRSIG